MRSLKEMLRHAAIAACASTLVLAGAATAQNRNNDYYQQQQRQQQQDQMRQQQQDQMRRQQQDQMRQQQQDQMRQQMRQQQQDQMRQQIQQQARQQQQDQMRGQMRQQQQDQARQQARQQQDQARQQLRDQQQSQIRQQARDQQANQTKQQIADQQRQLQNAQKAQLSGKPAPVGTSQSIVTRTADRMVFSNGVAKLTRPLTSSEIKRGFTGKVTEDGRALVEVNKRIFAIPQSRAGYGTRNDQFSETSQSNAKWKTLPNNAKSNLRQIFNQAVSSDLKSITNERINAAKSARSGGGDWVTDNPLRKKDTPDIRRDWERVAPRNPTPPDSPPDDGGKTKTDPPPNPAPAAPKFK